MKVVTKDYQSYKCKFIKYEDDKAILSLHDDTEEIINIIDIGYISLS